MGTISHGARQCRLMPVRNTAESPDVNIPPKIDRMGRSIERDYESIGFLSLGENDYSLVYVENLEATGKLSQRVGPMLVPANNQARCMSLE